MPENDPATPLAMPPLCATCGKVSTGPHCSECGERKLPDHPLSIWHFISHNLVHEFTHLDGRVPRTLKALFFRPGLLSQEYFAGRRKPYVNPVRLLLIAVIVFALLAPGNSHVNMLIGNVRLSLVPPGPPAGDSIQDTADKLDMFGLLSREVVRVSRTKDINSPAAIEKFHHELKTYGTALSFSNVLLLAGFLFVVFHRRRHYFVEHLVFSLHFAAFVLLFSILPMRLFDLVGLFPHWQNVRVLQAAIAVIAFLVLIIQLVYLQKGLVRFYYPQSSERPRWWSRERWKARVVLLILFLANSLFWTVVYAAGAAIALLRL